MTRIAIFTHDTYGLGHVRRCMHIVRAFSERLPDSSILLITGSPASGVMRDLPDNARRYVERIESLVEVPAAFLSVGPGRDEIIQVHDPFDL